MPTVSARALAAVPAVAIGIVVAVVITIVVHPLAGLALAVVSASAVLWLLRARATPSALSVLGAVPLPEGVEPRLESLVESVCASHGITEPTLHLVATDAVDAAVVGRPDDTHLVVTRGLLDRLDRLELEAVVARQLSLFGSGVEAATVLASTASWVGPLGETIRGRLLDERRLARADFDAVAVTRYPPALASALTKAADGLRVGHADRADHLWMVGSGASSIQPDVSERVDALREL